jgi:methyl-accepting chemotaxis protein
MSNQYPWTRLKKGCLLLKDLSLRWKVLIPVVGAILVLAVVIFGVSQSIIRDQAEKMALSKVQSDLALMYELIDEKLQGPWRAEGSILYKGNQPLNGNNELVDFLADLTGNTVTIFRDGTRIATTVLVEGKRAVGTQAADNVIEQVLVKKAPYYGQANVVGSLFQTGYLPLLDAQGNAVGMLYTGADQSLIDETVEAFRNSLFLLSTVMILLIVIVLYVFLSQSVLRPIALAATRASLIAKGDLTEAINQRDMNRGDEIGVLARSFHELRESLREVINILQEMTTQAAETGENLLAASEENSATIEEVASSVNEFSGNLADVSIKAEGMTKSAHDVRELAFSGQKEMDITVHSMDRIVESSRQTKEAVAQVSEAATAVGQILEIISNVADQTNLLALNAAIEAARAGEQGRGFAVVAEEVRQLAVQTQDAVTQIASTNSSLMQQVARAVTTIDETQAEVAQGHKALDQMRASFESIVTHIDGIVERINDVAQSSSTMHVTSENLAAATEEQAAAMNEIATMAEAVANMVGRLQKAISRFKV